MKPLSNDRCPLCGGPNGCVPAATGSFEQPCWCTTIRVDPAVLRRIPEARRNVACLCRACAEASAAPDMA
ncbi:MAG: cysteine-rich CWC family protein [Burkholderiales bacterium]